jgi:hypothetical protein
MGISLAKFGRVAWSEVAQHIQECDVAYFGGQDKIRVLLDLNCYDASTVRAVASYKDDPALLDSPARYLLEVVSAVPRAYEKLACMEFICKLDELKTSVTEPVSKLRTACSDVRKSLRFKALLRDVILPLGNKLNEGSKKVD